MLATASHLILWMLALKLFVDYLYEEHLTKVRGIYTRESSG